jgi:pimeloyl-ACP methyl ester carboxylesterase
MRRTLIVALASALLMAPGSMRAADGPVVASERQADGQLPDKARWRATVPANWNGTLLLWSHGYGGGALPASADDAPAAHRAALLAAGYALAGSTYAEPGWAIKSAVPDQLDTVAAFTRQFGKPKRVIAWGMSMGALVTTAIVERAPARVDGGLALCGSIGGAVGMMNMALDGAYAFRTLVAPDAGIRLVRTGDDRENGARVNAALATAQGTAQGRARVALAAVLGGLPGWTSAEGPQPADEDYAAQEAEMAKTFTMGVFLPRGDQERRSGGSFSWNSGVDYRAQVQRSGRRAMVRALYAAAGLELDADLARLNAGTRITADPAAVRYMTDYYTPNGRPAVPLLAVQMIGDGLTSPSLQRAYGEAAAAAGRGALVRTLWVRGAGHCTFDTPTVLASLALLNVRLDKRRWPAPPATFVAYTPPPMLRPCVRGTRCS